MMFENPTRSRSVSYTHLDVYKRQHMWIPRDVEARLKHSAKTRPVIVLTGARQTGKTSTFRHLFPDYALRSTLGRSSLLVSRVVNVRTS